MELVAIKADKYNEENGQNHFGEWKPYRKCLDTGLGSNNNFIYNFAGYQTNCGYIT